MKNTIIIICLVVSLLGFSQNVVTNSTIFEKINSEMQSFKIDTSAVPNDKLSKKIKELRELRGGFNINEAIQYKLSEEKIKTDANAEELVKIHKYFTSGYGKKWLDNAIIWIYRKRFTYNEIKDLIKFYKSSTGQKMATQFPIIMLQSLKCAEEITENYKKSKI